MPTTVQEPLWSNFITCPDLSLSRARPAYGWAWFGAGAVAAVAAAALFGFSTRFWLYPFLAVNDRIASADTLVVDGWLPTLGHALAADEFRRGGYRRVVILCPAYGFNAVDHDRGNADVLRLVYRRFGVPPDRIFTLVFAGLNQDRTSASAAALLGWLNASGNAAAAFNLVTLGPHARRSRLFFRRIFAGRDQCGVIPVEDPAYNPAGWWNFSEGIREVPFEGLAYLRARL